MCATVTCGSKNVHQVLREWLKLLVARVRVAIMMAATIVVLTIADLPYAVTAFDHFQHTHSVAFFGVCFANF